MSAERFHYKAFISYNHSDTKVAVWLHRALESYRIPSRLVGHETATGTIGKRIGTVFRDRDELPVSAELSGMINEALAASQFLVVLCSPSSARSKWVNQEVINFKRLRGAESIIAVIVDGEPGASALPDRADQECFVPGLRFQVDVAGRLTDQPAEPIAADLRPGKDGKRLVKLKVLAGLLGLGLDELARRENQRHQRFMTAVTFSSLALVGVMGALTFSAIESKNAAQIAEGRAIRQKDQAEGLIEFMLGDLRKKLEPVGRLEVLDSVGIRALEYFGTLQPDELDAETLGRKSRALHLIGEIQDLRGDLNKARESFAAASEMTKELLALDPVNPQRIYDHAQSVYWLGIIDWRRGETAKAEVAFHAYQDLANRLAERAGSNLEWKKEQAYAYNNIAVLLFQARRYAEAVSLFEAGQDVFVRLEREVPEDRSLRLDHARLMSWLSSSYLQQGLLQRAQVQRLAELAVYSEILQSDPKNKAVSRNLIPALIALGRTELDLGEITSATNHFKDANAQALELAKFDPENTQWLELASRTELDLSDALRQQGDILQSRASLESASKFGSALALRNGEVLEWQSSILLRAALLRAKLDVQERQFSDGLRQVMDAGANADQLLNKNSGRTALKLQRSEAFLLEGDALAGLGRRNEALKSWHKALDLAFPLRTQMSTTDKIVLGQMFQRLSMDKEAASLATELLDLGIRSKDVLPLYGRYKLNIADPK